MENSNKIRPGAVVVIQGGKYDGQGAQVRKIDREAGRVEVMIAGRVVKLDAARVGGVA